MDWNNLMLKIMKNYCIDVDITMSKQFHIEAESEQEAKKIFEQKMRDNLYEQISGHKAYVCHEITDIYEEDWLWKVISL